MAQETTVERTRRAFVPDEAWLAKQARESILEPDLPIVDPHHHLWDHANHRYLLDELLADTGSGHTITATVYIDCRSMYRADGPPEMKPVGETEFANGVAAMSASGVYGPTRACAGIVSYVDMMLGARARAVLEAHVAAGNGRFRGIRPVARHPPRGRRGREPRRAQQPHQPAAGALWPGGLPRGRGAAGRARPQLRGLAISSATEGSDGAGRRRAANHHDPQPLRRTAGHRALCRQGRRRVRDLESRHGRAGALPQRGREAGG